MVTHQFPPTVWQYQDWSVTGLSVFFGLSMLAAVICLVKARSSMIASILWPVCLAFFGLILFYQWTARIDGSRRVDLLQLTLNALVVVVVIVGIFRNWTLTVDKFSPYEGFFVAVIALLIFTIMQPSLVTPRPSATRTQCRNNLKAIGLAMHNYHDEYSTFPSAANGHTRKSWRINLLPFLDQRAVQDRYDINSEWDSELNLPLSREIVKPYDCPQRPDGRNRTASRQFLTAYVAPIGPDTVFSGNTGSTIRDITDGISNTLMILEACGSEIVWTEPRDIPVTQRSISVNATNAKLDYSDSLLSSYHTGGAQALLGDGSARFVGENIDPSILEALLTRSGGENLGEW